MAVNAAEPSGMHRGLGTAMTRNAAQHRITVGKCSSPPSRPRGARAEEIPNTLRSQRIYDPIAGYGHCVMAVVGLLKNTRSASVRTFTSGPSWTTNNSTVPGRAPVTSTVVVAVSIGLFPLPVKIGHGCAGPRGGPSPFLRQLVWHRTCRRRSEFMPDLRYSIVEAAGGPRCGQPEHP